MSQHFQYSNDVTVLRLIARAPGKESNHCFSVFITNELHHVSLTHEVNATTVHRMAHAVSKSMSPRYFFSD